MFVAALLLSAALHLFVSFVVAPRLHPLTAEVPIEVSYQSEPPTIEWQIEKAKQKPKRKPDDKQAPELATVERKPPPIEPPEPLPVQPKKVELPKIKMVDQEQFPEEPDNSDAQYLAQKNHRTLEETQERERNLVRAMNGKRPPTEKSNHRDLQIGGAEDRLAHLEKRNGADKSVPRGNPQSGLHGGAQERELAKPVRPSHDAVAPEPRRVAEDKNRGDGGRKLKMQLSRADYDRVFGHDAPLAPNQPPARSEVSLPKGSWAETERMVESMRSALENFTPEVKVGNQSELGTRASPFAAYYAAMHRQIHEFWALGFVRSVLFRGGKYADEELYTELEIVVQKDGTLASVPQIARSSGLVEFDAAAIQAVRGAAPFPLPPESIKSGNGKIYVHWEFHRGPQLCGTEGVHPYILNNGDRLDTPNPPAAAVTSTTDLPERSASKSKGASLSTSDFPERSAAKSKGASRPNLSSQTTISDGEEDLAAKKAAEGWLAAYARRSVAWLAGSSAVPFTAGGHTVAQDGATLKQIYSSMIEEEKTAATVGPVEIDNAATIKQRLGSLPPGGEDTDMLFAVSKIGDDVVVLLLKKSSRGWRVCGINR